ncbi:MAG: alpha/beta hydrolase [Gammaproteobacteria bacterium]|nr:alpha/beta hydrolase [Gammaproteobacteria bacterium]NND36082.1 alpha/beta hydrolase [Gammaproteobacteria bacterium]
MNDRREFLSSSVSLATLATIAASGYSDRSSAATTTGTSPSVAPKEERDADSEIRRGFVDVSFGQVHYRYAGQGPTVVLLHASPGSSKQLEGLILRLAENFRVLSPDTPGNGDSTPLPLANPDIADYSRGILEFLDAMQVESAAFYGSHTGACLGSELALLAPDRVSRLIQDGVAIFTEAEREELIATYAHPFEPDLNGTHLVNAFMFCRDQFIFFPWYASDKAHLRDVGLPPPGPLHDWVLEVLKAATTYHLAYRAAFAYPAEKRLPLVQQPVLCIAAEDDPLRAVTEEITPSIPDGRYHQLPRFDADDYHARLNDAITSFLQG